MSRPALRITRHDADDGSARFDFEVWNPWTGAYEPQPDLPAALHHVDTLLERVRQMWVSQDPTQTTLHDAPDPDRPDDLEWAEFRVSAQANREHETRNFDALHWRKAMGGRQGAIEATCNEVGFRPE
ncbi:MAG: hypothetical protein H7Z10_03480 [Gemmatimonadaceae bacterium]|nr:hypothetical protein [Acetobacteraceae bacterium]